MERTIGEGVSWVGVLHYSSSVSFSSDPKMKASGGKARGGDSSKAKSEAMSNPKERHSLEASRTVASAASPASAKRVFMKRRKVSASTERESVRVEEAKDGAPKKEPVSESPLGEGRTEPGASREFQARGGKQLEKAVFVRNLPFDATPQAVSGILSRFGKVEEVFLVRNDAGECKGTAFVYFESEVRLFKGATSRASLLLLL